MRVMGGAIFVAAGQSGFSNGLILEIPRNAPGIDINQIVLTRATDLAIMFPSDAIPGIIRSYMTGLQVAYKIVIVSSGIVSLG